jgi:hypothetical protein
VAPLETTSDISTLASKETELNQEVEKPVEQNKPEGSLPIATTPTSTSTSTSTPTPAPKPTPAPTVFTYGNTSGNFMNGAAAAFDGQFIYFYNGNDGNKIYRIKPDRSGLSKVSSNSGTAINVIGDWVYYCGIIDQGIFKVKKDGSDQTKISAETSLHHIHVVNDWIYYYVYIGEGVRELYKIKTDGTNKVKIPLNSNLAIIDDQPFVILGDWIYINLVNTSERNIQLYRVKTDGSSASKIVGSAADYFAIENGWIYYIDGSVRSEIRKVKVDGTGMSTIYKTSTSDTSLNSLNVSGNQIFFCADNQFANEVGIYMINLDGLSLTKLTNTKAKYLDIVSNWIYFKGPYQQMKIRTDGSQESLVP